MKTYDIFEWIAIGLSGVSLFSALIFIILIICCFRQISSSLSLKLTLCVQICDAFFSIGIISIAIPIDQYPICCKLQAFFLQFGGLCSVLARLAITVILYMAVKQNNFTNETLETLVFLVIGIISLIISAL